MANEFIRILDNQIEGIKQDKLNSEQWAIDKRNSILEQLYGYVDKTREIVESANYLQSLGYRFWNNNPCEVANGRIPMKAYLCRFDVGLICKDYFNCSSSDTITGVGIFSSGNSTHRLISIEDGNIYITTYERKEIISKTLAYESDCFLEYSGRFHAQSLLCNLPEFIGRYTDMVNNFRYSNYKQFK